MWWGGEAWYSALLLDTPSKEKSKLFWPVSCLSNSPPPQELLLLIHEHLKASGLHGAAAALAKEAALARVTASMAAAAQNTPMPLPPPQTVQPLNPLPVAGTAAAARMAAAAPHHQPSGLHHPRPLAPAATGNHHQSAASPSPAIAAGGDAWPFIAGPSRTGTPLGLAGRAGGGATMPSFPAPASSKMKKVLGVSPSLQLGPAAAAASTPWGTMGGSAAATAATPGGAATTPQPQPQPKAAVATLPQLTLSPAVCAAATTEDAATTPRLAVGGGTGKRAREVPSAVAAPAASVPASAPTPAAAGAGDKRKAAAQLLRPLSEAAAPPLRQAGSAATAAPFAGPAPTPFTEVSAVTAAASASPLLPRSSPPFSQSELQGATFHTPAAATNNSTAAAAAAAALNDRALPAPRTLSPFVHHLHPQHQPEAATPAAPAAAATTATTVNALLLDLPSSRQLPAQQAGGGGGLFRRAGSSGPEGLPPGSSSLSTLLARAGSGGGTATASSLVSAPPPPPLDGPALMAPEPTELPRFLEAACREVRTLAGPPANSKLHSIVMAYLKHQHRQACMQSAAPTSTLPPIPLSKPYALPQVGRGGGLRRRWGHLNATGQGSAYCPR